jgi:multiple sugar transport system permease protein
VVPGLPLGQIRYRRPVNAAVVVRRLAGSVLKHGVLWVFSIMFLFPFLWMVSTSLKSNAQVYLYPPVWIPHPLVWKNYVDAVTEIHFFRYLFNTLRYAVLSSLGACISAPIVAYGFAKIDWPGRDVFFFITLSLLMLPGQVTLVPLFLLFHRIGWVGTYKPLIVPAFFGSPFYIFLARQFYRQVPNSVIEAARIDGAGEFRIFAQIVTPLILPAVATIALFQFTGAWSDFLGPLIYISRDSLYPLSIGLTAFESVYSTQWQLLMAGATLFTLPMVLLYFFVQRTFIKGVQFAGMVG